MNRTYIKIFISRFSFARLLLIAIPMALILVYIYPPGRARLQVNLKTNTDTTFQIYWADKNQNYLEERSVSAEIKRGGPHQYTLLLPDLREIDKLRIDPARTSCEVTISSLVIKQISYEPIRLSKKNELCQLIPQYDIINVDYQSDGISIISGGVDPQMELSVTPSTACSIRLLIHYYAIAYLKLILLSLIASASILCCTRMLINIYTNIQLQKVVLQIAHFTIIVVCLILFIDIAQMAIIAIKNNFPNHCREAIEAIATHVISIGESPSSLSTFPKNTNGYVLGNHVFSSLFVSPGDGYQSIIYFMRSSFWLFSFLAAILLIIVCLREQVPLSISCVAAVIYLIHFTCLRNEMGSKPGSLGNFIFLIGMTAPYFFRFSYIGMLLGIILLLTATFTKQLFMTGIPVLLAYYLLFHNREKAIILGALTVLLFFAFLALYELYLPNSMGIFENSHFRLAGGYSKMLIEKLRFIHHKFWPLIYISLLYLYYKIQNVIIYSYKWFKNRKISHATDIEGNAHVGKITKAIKFCRKPFDIKVHYEVFCALSIILLYYGYLVKNTAHSHYYYRLFTLFKKWTLHKLIKNQLVKT